MATWGSANFDDIGYVSPGRSDSCDYKDASWVDVSADAMTCVRFDAMRILLHRTKPGAAAFSGLPTIRHTYMPSYRPAGCIHAIAGEISKRDLTCATGPSSATDSYFEKAMRRAAKVSFGGSQKSRQFLAHRILRRETPGEGRYYASREIPDDGRCYE